MATKSVAKKTVQKKPASKPAPPGSRVSAKPAASPDVSSKPEPKAKKTRAKSKKPAEKPVAAKAKAKTPGTRSRKAKGKIEIDTASAPNVPLVLAAPVEDPIGDVTDGEARSSIARLPSEPLAELAAYRADTAEEALDGTLDTTPETGALAPEKAMPEAEKKAAPYEGHVIPGESEPPARPERLQKILSQAGIASRRRAEEMILAGRVKVNGQLVTQLGVKADPARDHIRVDGKLIHGAERHRYFVLNKPRGFVTTVSDPEGRPTVMQFFSKMRERLYPVGRLDYDSEGLLLVTNDGDLANRLTRAASGVEKTYWVKVAGRPTEEELDRLRSGIFIERGDHGSERVPAAPARIREVRYGAKAGSQRTGSPPRGENPWFEVVLIEGRNRELRKMFQAIGHYVEKIRRVGYGPLVLDLEPGNFRELRPEELSVLRLAAAGKSRPKSSPTQENRSPQGKPRWQPSFAPRERDEHSTGERGGFANSRAARFGAPSRSGRFQDRAQGDRPAREPRRFGPAPGARKPFRDRQDTDFESRPRWKQRGFASPPQQRSHDAGPPARSGDSHFQARREGARRKPWSGPPAPPFRDRPAKPGGQFSRGDRRDQSRQSFGRDAGKSSGRKPGAPGGFGSKRFPNRAGKRLGSGPRPGGRQSGWSQSGGDRPRGRDRG